jgi:CDP-diacylglycerol--serine O-phosphatidyltransferase
LIEALYVVVVAGLMVSRIPHYSGKTIGRVPREAFVFVLFAVAAILILLASFPLQMLIGVSLLYLAMIPFSIRAFRRLSEQEAAQNIGTSPPSVQSAAASPPVDGAA